VSVPNDIAFVKLGGGRVTVYAAVVTKRAERAGAATEKAARETLAEAKTLELKLSELVGRMERADQRDQQTRELAVAEELFTILSLVAGWKDDGEPLSFDTTAALLKRLRAAFGRRGDADFPRTAALIRVLGDYGMTLRTGEGSCGMDEVLRTAEAAVPEMRAFGPLIEDVAAGAEDRGADDPPV
jgi:hypothetical protein